jgi:NitT/TauT family transport system substrate-binding protein
MFAIPAVLLTALLGCGQTDSESGDTNGPQQVRLGYFANLTHAQAVLGVASGEYEKVAVPAKFSTKIFNAGPSLIEAILAGEVDIGYIGPGPALSAHEKTRGQGIRIVAGAAANGVLIVARKDSGINSLADLKGKKIATPQLGNTQDLAARHYVMKDLKQPDANNVLPVPNAEQAGLMVRKSIDAAWAPEPWATRLVSEGDGQIIAAESDLWPNQEVTLALVITTPEFLQKHPQVVEEFLKVHTDWTDRLQKEPQKYIGQLGDALYAINQKRLPPGVLEKAILNVKFTNDPLEQTLATMAQWSFDLGFARDQTRLDGLVDLTLLKKILGNQSEAGDK